MKEAKEPGPQCHSCKILLPARDLKPVLIGQETKYFCSRCSRVLGSWGFGWRPGKLNSWFGPWKEE